MKYCKVVSKKEFDKLEPDVNAVAIRIIDPEGENHSNIDGYKDELRIEFWDIDDDIGRLKAITDEQAKIIYDFMIKNINAEALVVHCMAGVSRSNTIAQFFAFHIAKDDYIASLLSSDTTKIINYGIWDKLKKQAQLNNNWHITFS